MLSALVTVTANCVSELTQRQGRELRQSTVVPGVPMVSSEVGSSSNREDVGCGLLVGLVVVLPVLPVLFVVTLLDIGTILDPVPSVSADSVVVLGVTSLIIVSLHAPSNKQLVRTISPLMCNLYTRLSLMKYDQLSTFFPKGEADNIDLTVSRVR